MKTYRPSNTPVALTRIESTAAAEPRSFIRSLHKRGLGLVILGLMFACLSVRADITTGISAYLQLDETSGLTAADATGHGHDGSLLNFVNDDSQWVLGRTNGACFFNVGASNYAILADPGNALDFSTNPTPAFTLAAWVRGDWNATQLPGAGILCKGYGRGGEAYFLDLYQNNFRFFVRGSDNTGYGIQKAFGGTFDVNTNLYPISGYWELVVGVYDSTEPQSTNRMKLYINGQLVARQNGPTALYSTTHDVSVAAREDNSGSGYNLPFAGRVDDVRIYNRALSASDVLELYQAAGPFAPDIIIQPVGANVFAGDPVSFSVVSDGDLPLAYQWQHEGTNIAGATTTSYTINSCQLTDAGVYTVAITNAAGYSISSNAVLNVSDPAPDIASGLLAHLKLDETTGLTAFDATANGHDATLLGFVGDDSQWVSARDLGGLLCTNNEYATIDDSNGALDFATNTTPAFSVALWVKAIPGIQVNDAGIVAKGFGNGEEQFAIDLHNNVYRFYLRDGAGVGGFDLNSAATADGSWQYLVAVYNHTNAEKFYVNGQLVASRPAGPATLFDNLHEISLAARESGNGTGYDRPFAGTLDDVRLYNRALTPTEVQMLYTNAGIFGPEIVTDPANTTNFVLTLSSLSVVASGTFPLTYQWRHDGTDVPNATNATITFPVSQLTDSGFYTVVISNLYGGSITSAPAYLSIVELADDDYTSGMVAEWNFDETSGSIAADSTGHGNALNLSNFPFDDSQWVTTSRIGGRALRYNSVDDDVNGGQNDYAETTNGLAMPYNYNLFTFAFWIKLDSSSYGSNPRVITPTIRPWALWSSAGGMRIYNGTGGANPQLNKWTHYALVYDRVNHTYSCYVNGVKTVNNAVNVEAKAAPTASTLWVVGHNENVAATSDTWRGQLDDLRVYNRLLTDSQVAALYAAAPPFIQVVVQPQSVTVSERDSVTLSVAGDSSQPITYQWFKGVSPVPGATNATLTFSFVKTADAGEYSVVLSNIVGTATSDAATLTVNALPAADLTSDLLVHYKFDETTGDNAADSSGHGYDATLYNWDVGSPKWDTGVMGNALRFNSLGTSNYVQTPFEVVYNNVTDFTFTFWAKVGPETISGNPRFFGAADGVSWVVWQRTGPPRGIGFWHGGGAPEPETSGWHQYVVVYSRITGRFDAYMDGVRRSAGSVPTNPNASQLLSPDSIPWIIGHHEKVSPPNTNDGESFRGWLDDMRIYNRLFNLNDVEALYDASGVPEPLLTLSLNGNTINLSWPAWASDFAPESTDTLVGGTWTTVPGTPAFDGGLTRSLTDTFGPGTKYYRLHRNTP